jgi:8-oxo-dGTP diphosphatase
VLDVPDGEGMPKRGHPRKAMTRIVVAAAVVEQGDRILVTRRLAGTHLAGYWEFPGGKCEASETLEACLVREMLEELGIETVVGRELLALSHDYDDRSVELHFFECRVAGPPIPRLGQELAWVARSELTTLPLPPADAALVRLLTSADR